MTQTLEALQADIDELARLGVSEAYRAKQLHRIPPAPVVDRVRYILQHCQGKRVLHLGCGWPPGYLHQALAKVATQLRGIDIAVPVGTPGDYLHVDLDHLPSAVLLPGAEDFEIFVVAEILEHLGNPGNLLAELREYGYPVLITVPNAHSRVGRHHLSGGVENVHIQHTAWYSYRTLRTLVERYGYEIDDFAWYNCPMNAQPQESEGLIMLVH